MTNEELGRALRQLRLGGIADSLEVRAQQARADHLCPLTSSRSDRSQRDESAALHGHLECATTPEQMYRELLLRGRTSHQTVFAVGRELLGFILAIASVVKVTSDQTATA